MPIYSCSPQKLPTLRQDDALDSIFKQPPGEKFDIVFLDPPFAADMLDELCRLLEESVMLGEGALIYIEDDRGAA